MEITVSRHLSREKARENERWLQAKIDDFNAPSVGSAGKLRIHEQVQKRFPKLRGQKMPCRVTQPDKRTIGFWRVKADL